MLTVTGIGKQRQRLVGMCRQDHLIEALCLATTRRHHRYMIRVTRDRIDRRAEPQPLARRTRQRLHVAEPILRGPPASGADHGTTASRDCQKTRPKNAAGKLHIWSGSADHTADACGTINRSMNIRE